MSAAQPLRPAQPLRSAQPLRPAHTPWTGTEALPQGSRLLLEASAGTGKTWQIAHLVSRLVAEEGLGIERMLLITFTNAATAELRDRVRRRLVQLQQALLEQLPAGELDPLLVALQQHPERQLLLSRVTAALTGFDQAPISTIHGFCQRMLTQLAFESGQSPGLEVLADTSALVGELIDDELACLFAGTDEVGVGIAKSLGWSRDGLAALAKPMAAAVAPQLQPPPSRAPGRPGEAILEVIAGWRALADQTRAWLDDPLQGGAALQAFLAEMDLPTGRLPAGVPRRRFDGRYGTALPDKGLQDLRQALDAGMPVSDWSVLDAWSLEKAEKNWKDGAFSDFAGSALFVGLNDLRTQLTELFPIARSEFAARVRATLDAELERRGALSYEAMLWRLAERIEQEGPQGPLARAVRERFDVALIDEFQDTDAAQWAVLRSAFAHAERRLLLIGDPKQAIYAFRGADVHVYLQAAEGPPDQRPQRATMNTNWRSDQALVRAMNHLWDDKSQAFGAVPFDYIAVDPAPKALHQALVAGGPSGKPRCPLEIRWLDARVDSPEAGPFSNKDRATKLVYRALVREIVSLLQPEARLELKGGPAGGRPVRPKDLTVLVRSNKQADTIQQMLLSIGIAAVASSTESVMQSAAAEWLLTWLDALADPGREGLARSAAVSPLFGWTLPELAEALQRFREVDGSLPERQVAEESGAKDWGAWLADLQRWATLWTEKGFIPVWEQAQAKHHALQRLIACESGERHATDLRHLVELCHAEERTHRSGPAGLAAWLRQQRSGEERDELARRLESDDEAVQVVTIHKSKGLEYPIVLAPFLWDTHSAEGDSGQALSYHSADGQLTLNVHAKGSEGRAQILQTLNAEALQEETRLLYVALTRAAHHAVAWLVPAGETAKAPERNAWVRLVLRERDAQGRWLSDDLPAPLETKKGAPPPDVAPWLERVDHLCATSQGTVGWSIEQPFDAALQAPPLERQPAPDLQPGQWTRGSLRGDWSVTSYTALTRGHSWDGDSHRDEQRAAAAQPPIATDPAAPREADPPETEAEQEELTQGDANGADGAQGAAADNGNPQAEAWRKLGAGPGVGTWVHAVLEQLEFTGGRSKDRKGVSELIAELGTRHAVPKGEQHQALQQLIPSWLATPLGGPSGLPRDFALGQLALQDRLDELPFDLAVKSNGANLQPEALREALLPLLQGDRGAGPAWLSSVLQGKGIFPSVPGILTGTIDLVMRVDGRFYIADYKTNRLKDAQGQVLAAPQYRGEELARAMAEHGYHLQALLYSLAVYRWLRQRRGKHFNFEAEFGGHLYLFLRGMDGSGLRGPDGACSGVFAERWPLEFIQALDTALRPTQPAQGGEA